VNASIAARHRRVAHCQASERYGVDGLATAFDAILDHGSRSPWRSWRGFPTGPYAADDVIDGDGLTDDPIPIRVAVTVANDSLVADFTGTAPQTRGPINCTEGALYSACKTVVRAITSPAARSNDGFFRPFRLIVPPGTVFSAQTPAATGWYYEASAYATELVWKALAPVIRDHRLLGATRACPSATSSAPRHGRGLRARRAAPAAGGTGRDKDGERSSQPRTIRTTSRSRSSSRAPGSSSATSSTSRPTRGRGVAAASMHPRVPPARRQQASRLMEVSAAPPPVGRGGQLGSNNYLEYEKLDGTHVRRGRSQYILAGAGDRGPRRPVSGGYGDRRAWIRRRRCVLDGYITPAQARSVASPPTATRLLSTRKRRSLCARWASAARPMSLTRRPTSAARYRLVILTPRR
jgi:N-methylhydantoinase B